MTNPFTHPTDAHPTDALLPHMKLSALWALKSNARRRWPERAPLPGARPPRPKPTITGRTAYKSYVASYTQQNSQSAMLVQNFVIASPTLFTLLFKRSPQPGPSHSNILPVQVTRAFGSFVGRV